MSLKDDIKPSSYLKEHSDELVSEIAESERTVVITQNGEAKAVLMSVEQYERWQEAVAMLKLLSLSEKSLHEGSVVPHDKVFKNIDKMIEEASSLEKEAV